MTSVHLCGTHHMTRLGMPVVEYEVLYDGVKYRCDSLQLDLLYKGLDPERDLDLTRIDDDDDGGADD